VQAAALHSKGTFAVDSITAIPSLIRQAVELSLSGRPGGVYVDLPADVLHAK
jgi:thiamine pyrophosphate-dependent acetolactate synthase large subunit-like protein